MDVTNFPAISRVWIHSSSDLRSQFDIHTSKVLGFCIVDILKLLPKQVINDKPTKKQFGIFHYTSLVLSKSNITNMKNFIMTNFYWFPSWSPLTLFFYLLLMIGVEFFVNFFVCLLSKVSFFNPLRKLFFSPPLLVSNTI